MSACDKSIKLAVFDFDATIIKDNSDTYINELIFSRLDNSSSSQDETGEDLIAQDKARLRFPNEIESLYRNHNWPTRMNAFFKYIHDKYSITSQTILDELRKIKIEDSMKSLFFKLKENGYDIIILSDANNLFIETILEANDLLDLFRNKILSNPTHFDETGVIKIKPYYMVYKEDKKPFDCKVCLEESNEPSICKGSMVRTYLNGLISQQGLSLDKAKVHLIYSGDGKNDYCPGLFLKSDDYYFPRKGFNLAKLLEKTENSSRIVAKIKYWNDANEIINQLEF